MSVMDSIEERYESEIAAQKESLVRMMQTIERQDKQIAELTAERDGYQTINFGLQDSIKKHAAELTAYKANNYDPAESIRLNSEVMALKAEVEKYRTALKNLKEEHDTYQRANWDYIMPIIEEALREENTEQTISDGFGSTWNKKCAMCGQDTMEIVRPGKVQCADCG